MSTWSKFEAPNIGLLFYKQIYKEQIFRNRIKLDDKGELTIQVSKDEKSPFDDFYADLYLKTAEKYKLIVNPAATNRFLLYTTYPGLLAGSGYTHDSKTLGDFKIGFYFDHTSGQPVIPGSSVKGVCRSVFEVDVDEKGKNYSGENSKEVIKAIFQEILDKDTTGFVPKEQIKKIVDSITPDKIIEIVGEIFGKDKKGNDIFFDAVLDINKNKTKQLLVNDFITPHLDVLKNPIPIQFLKVKPRIAFEFRFKLCDSGEWKKEIKELFFKQVLLTLGVGAKTNVGYGAFTE